MSGAGQSSPSSSLPLLPVPQPRLPTADLTTSPLPSHHTYSTTQSLTPAPQPIAMAPTKARLIGSLLFCPTCSTLLDLPGDADVIVCEQCGHEEPAECTLYHSQLNPRPFIAPHEPVEALLELGGT